MCPRKQTTDYQNCWSWYHFPQKLPHTLIPVIAATYCGKFLCRSVFLWASLYRWTTEHNAHLSRTEVKRNDDYLHCKQYIFGTLWKRTLSNHSCVQVHVILRIRKQANACHWGVKGHILLLVHDMDFINNCIFCIHEHFIIKAWLWCTCTCLEFPLSEREEWKRQTLCTCTCVYN